MVYTIRRLILVVLIAMLSLTACGDSDETDAPRLDSAVDNRATQDKNTTTSDDGADTSTGSNLTVDLSQLLPITVQNAPDLQILRTISTPAFIWEIMLTDDYLVGYSTTTVYVWDRDTLNLEHEITTANADLWDAAVSPDGTYILTSGSDGAFEAWAIATGEPIEPPLTPELPVTDMIFTPDGDLVLGQVEAVIQYIELPSGEVRWRDSWQRGYPRAMLHTDISVAAGKVVTVQPAASLNLWDIQTGEQTRLIGHTSDVHYASFSPDGSLVASAGADNNVRLWRVSEAAQINNFNHFYDAIMTAFSPDGSLLVTSGMDSRLLVWDLNAVPEENAPPEALYEFTGDLAAAGTDPVAGLAFNGDGTLLYFTHGQTLNLLGVTGEASDSE